MGIRPSRFQIWIVTPRTAGTHVPLRQKRFNAGATLKRDPEGHGLDPVAKLLPLYCCPPLLPLVACCPVSAISLALAATTQTPEILFIRRSIPTQTTSTSRHREIIILLS